jgi:hypothetical protein
MPAREDFIGRLPDRQGSKTFSKAQLFSFLGSLCVLLSKTELLTAICRRFSQLQRG